MRGSPFEGVVPVTVLPQSDSSRAGAGRRAATLCVRSRKDRSAVTVVADCRLFVIGVDTQAKTCPYAVVAATGQSLGGQQFPTTGEASPARSPGPSHHRTRRGAVGGRCLATCGARLAHVPAEAGYWMAEEPE